MQDIMIRMVLLDPENRRRTRLARSSAKPLLSVRLIFALALAAAATTFAEDKKDLAPPPPGATLPVILNETLKADKLRADQSISADLAQTVPLAKDVVLPAQARLEGRVVKVSRSGVSFVFDRLSWQGSTIPVHVRLVAAAGMMTVSDAGLPVGGTDRSVSSPGDYTTHQVGGDEVMRSNWSGKVYDQRGAVVGFANYSGVYKNPAGPAELPHAMGVFSTTASGLYGIGNLSVASPGGAGKPIRLKATKSDWTIRSGSALLLEVVP